MKITPSQVIGVMDSLPVAFGVFLLLGIAGLARPSEFRGGLKADKQDWGYVDVRPSAHMFWWLYYARTNPPTSAPLVIWLQGGPGASSTGFGNFMEIGPQDVNLNQRNVTWLRLANLLFIDNPVGAGFSYVTNSSALVSDNQQIADDLVTLLITFYKKHPEFENTPLYIFSESYGGKMTVGFGQALLQAKKAGNINCNFQGVALGDSWISPVDSTNTWGPYLHSVSLLDRKGLAAVEKAARAIQEALDQGKYREATSLWGLCEDVVEKETFGVSFYNILANYGETALGPKAQQSLSFIEKLYQRHVKPLQKDNLDELMNGPIKKKLGIPDNVTWGGQSGEVFQHLSEDFMKPVYSGVDELLNSTVKVVVYNGQLDLIVDTLGTEAWVQRLKWPGLPSFNDLSWEPVYVSTHGAAAFVKKYQNFSFYWILKAGHMVPADAPATAYKMLQLVTSQS